MRNFRALALFSVFLLLQATFSYSVGDIFPKISNLPKNVSGSALKLLEFGDSQFLYRLLSQKIQMAGDSYGRATKLEEYDYDVLDKWLYQINALDNKSNYLPSIAAYLYGNSNNNGDLIKIINYLKSHWQNTGGKNWWWLTQAIYIAKHKIKDLPLALDLAIKLNSTDKIIIPEWAKTLPLIILAVMGEHEAAMQVVQKIIDQPDITDQELNFINYFLEERLQSLGKN